MTKTTQLKSRVIEGFEGYTIERELNAGNFARVYKVREVTTGKRYAAKFIEKDKLSVVDHENVIREVDLMSRLNDHPNVIKLKESLETPEYYILVMELMRGGDLFDRLHEKEVFTEKETRRTMQQLATAVKHIHEKGIAHRDLKIENVMYSSTDSDAIKLGDFGLAKDIGRASSNTPVGTLHYMAPEVASRKFHSKSVDIWSLGCICFVLLYGTFPFFEDSRDRGYQDLREKVILGRFTFPEDGEHKNHQISEAAKDLISRAMMVDATKRLDIDEFIKHPWLTSCDDDDLDQNNDDEAENADSRNLNSTTSTDSISPITPESPLLGSSASATLGTTCTTTTNNNNNININTVRDVKINKAFPPHLRLHLEIPPKLAHPESHMNAEGSSLGGPVMFCESTSSTLVAKRSLSLSRLSLNSPELGENKPERRKKIRELFNTLIKVERARLDPAQREAEKAQERIPKRVVKLTDLIPSKLLQKRKVRNSNLRMELRQPSSPLGSVSS